MSTVFSRRLRQLVTRISSTYIKTRTTGLSTSFDLPTLAADLACNPVTCLTPLFSAFKLGRACSALTTTFIDTLEVAGDALGALRRGNLVISLNILRDLFFASEVRYTRPIFCHALRGQGEPTLSLTYFLNVAKHIFRPIFDLFSEFCEFPIPACLCNS